MMTGHKLIEMLNGSQSRRCWIVCEKLAIVPTYELGATVSLVARGHSVSSNQLFH